MNKKIIVTVAIAIVLAVVGAIFYFSSVNNKKGLIFENGNIRVFDLPSDNPLCGKISIFNLNDSKKAQRGRAIAEFEMCEESLVKVDYKDNRVIIETDGGMSSIPRYIRVDTETGSVSE